MVKIVIENLGKKEVPVNDFSFSVLQHVQAQYIDWMHACGAKGRCTSCKMIVQEGLENLSPLSAPELKYRQQGALGKKERLACQTKVTGDIVIEVPEEFKLPHMQYT